MLASYLVYFMVLKD